MNTFERLKARQEAIIRRERTRTMRQDMAAALLMGAGLTAAVFIHSVPLFLGSWVVFCVYLWRILFSGKGP